MMMVETPSRTGVLLVDDNPHVASALKVLFGRTKDLPWRGWLENADRLVEHVVSHCPSIIIIDLDMPGRDPFDAISELTERCPDSRAIVFSGHVNKKLIDRAVEAGVWG